MALFTTWQPIPTKTYSDVCRMATNTGTSYKLSLSFGNQHWNKVVVIFVTWQPAQASGEDSMGKQNSQAVEIHLLFFFLSEIDIFFSIFRRKLLLIRSKFNVIRVWLRCLACEVDTLIIHSIFSFRQWC